MSLRHSMKRRLRKDLAIALLASNYVTTSEKYKTKAYKLTNDAAASKQRLQSNNGRGNPPN
jgi:hypothetical protein